MFPSLLNLMEQAFVKYHVCVILRTCKYHVCVILPTQDRNKLKLCFSDQLEVYFNSKNILITLVKIPSSTALVLAKSGSLQWDFTPTTTQTFIPVLGRTGRCKLVGKLNTQQVRCSNMICRVCGGRLHILGCLHF